MKIILTLSIALMLVSPKLSEAQCKDRKIEKACKPLMKPFVVDGFGNSALPFDSIAKTVHVDFTAFAGEKYKLVFCGSGFAEDVQLEIYDKNEKAKKRNKMFEGILGGANQNLTYEPTKSGNYYIEYHLPSIGKAIPKSECVVLLIGYKD